MQQKPTKHGFAANVPEGWAVEDRGLYRFLVSREPPRPGSHFHLLKSDARNRQVAPYWAAGIALFSAGALAACAGMKAGWLWLALPGVAVGFAGLRVRWYVFVPVWLAVLAAVGAVGAADRPELAYPGLLGAFVGARLLAIMLFCFLMGVHNVRRGPVLRGEIHSLQPFPYWRGFSTADALLPDGRSFRVLVKTDPASALVGRDGGAEVLMLADPEAREARAIGIRPLARDKADADTGDG
jgi:hypothetical protein